MREGRREVLRFGLSVTAWGAQKEKLSRRGVRNQEWTRNRSQIKQVNGGEGFRIERGRTSFWGMIRLLTIDKTKDKTRTPSGREGSEVRQSCI